MVVRMDHPLDGGAGVALIGSPMRLSATPVEYRHPPPRLGEHTETVLRERLGLRDGDLEALRRQDVI